MARPEFELQQHHNVELKAPHFTLPPLLYRYSITDNRKEGLVKCNQPGVCNYHNIEDIIGYSTVLRKTVSECHSLQGGHSQADHWFSFCQDSV